MPHEKDQPAPTAVLPILEAAAVEPITAHTPQQHHQRRPTDGANKLLGSVVAFVESNRAQTHDYGKQCQKGDKRRKDTPHATYKLRNRQLAAATMDTYTATDPAYYLTLMNVINGYEHSVKKLIV